MQKVHISTIILVVYFILENVFVVPLVVAQKGRGGGGREGTVSVRGYYRQDGTYVQPHTRTTPDGDPTNNLGSRGRSPSNNPATTSSSTPSSVQPYDRSAPGEGSAQTPSSSSTSVTPATSITPENTPSNASPGSSAARLVPVGRAYRIQESFTGQVVGVHYGDTITVMREGQGVKVYLYGINTPELAQAFGKTAKQFTSDKAYQKEVTVRVHDTDEYGRLVSEVLLPDGESLNEAIIRNGLAWWYKQYAPKDTALAQFEAEARFARRGIWSTLDTISLWELRRP